MKRIMALAIFTGIGLIPMAVQAEGFYKGQIWREQRVEPQGIPVLMDSYSSAKTDGGKVAINPCQKKLAQTKPVPKLKKIKTMCADSCLKEVRRNSEVIRKLERERGAAEERERFTQEWFRNYREWYKKFGEWQAKPKSWL